MSKIFFKKDRDSKMNLNADRISPPTVRGIDRAVDSDGDASIKKGISFGDISNIHFIIVIFIIFGLYLIFYPESSFIQCFKTKNKINSVRNDIEVLNLEMKQDCVIINGLQNDKEYLKKYVRENLYFSKKDETIYVIDEDMK